MFGKFAWKFSPRADGSQKEVLICGAHDDKSTLLKIIISISVDISGWHRWRDLPKVKGERFMFTLGCDKCLFSGKLPQDRLTLPVSWGSFWKVRQDGGLDWYHHHHHYTAEPQLSVPSWKHTGVYILRRWHHRTPVPCFSQTGTLGCSPVACISKLSYPRWFIAGGDGWTLEQHKNIEVW